MFKAFLQGERLCKRLPQFMKESEIPREGRTDCALDLVVAGNHDGIDTRHLPGRLFPSAGLVVDPFQPAGLELSEAGGFVSADPFCEVLKAQAVVELVVLQVLQPGSHQSGIFFFGTCKTELLPHEGKIVFFKVRLELFERLLVLVLTSLQQHQAFRQPCQVPLGHSCLLPVGIAPHAINGTENLVDAELVHEGAGTVIECFTRDGTVIRIHDAVDETKGHPVRYELCLGFDHMFEKCQCRLFGRCGVGIVACNGVVRQLFQRITMILRREVLESSHPDMTRGDTRQHPARLHRLAIDCFSRTDSGQGACRRNTESVHCLAEQILAHYGTERRLPVSAARIGRLAGSLELNIVLPVVDRADHLAEQRSSPVAELRHEIAELVAGVSQGNGLATRQGLTATDNACQFLPVGPESIKPEMCCQFLVPGNQERPRRRVCLHRREEDLGQVGIAVDQVHGASVARLERRKTANSVGDYFLRNIREWCQRSFSAENNLRHLISPGRNAS